MLELLKSFDIFLGILKTKYICYVMCIPRGDTRGSYFSPLADLDTLYELEVKAKVEL